MRKHRINITLVNDDTSFRIFSCHIIFDYEKYDVEVDFETVLLRSESKGFRISQENDMN